jgi:hypothetical protein
VLHCSPEACLFRFSTIAFHWGHNLSFPEELVNRLLSNREKILRYMWIPQALTGLFFIGLSHFLGFAHFHLIREGLRAPGRIVAYQEEIFRRSSGSSSTSFRPVVEFGANDRVIQFRDWLGSNSTGALYSPVVVLYDPANPSDAMIDRPVWNWIPWAPTFAVGLFLVLVSIKGYFQSRRSAEIS